MLQLREKHLTIADKVMQYYFRKIYIAIALLLPAFLFSCDGGKVVVAEVGDKVLYDTDIPDIFPDGTSYEDSITLLQTYANSWVRKQLTLSEAEQNLSESKKNVTQQLEDYRTSLLIYRYEQQYVNQHLDTLITQEETQAFYEENKDKLRLPNPLAKAVYIKVISSSPYVKSIRDIYRLNDERNINDLNDICLQVAEKYDSFNDQWVDFSVIARLLPLSISSYETIAQKQRYIEDKDDTYTYFVKIQEFIPRGGFAPIEYEQKVIKSIILNNRRQKLLSELEQQIYDNAMQQNKVSININQ